MTTTTVKQKARRRPGPWTPIRPTIVPCRVIYTDALCADVPVREVGQSSRLRLTPRQQCKLAPESEAAA
jgi:hypothetical protein